MLHSTQKDALQQEIFSTYYTLETPEFKMLMTDHYRLMLEVGQHCGSCTFAGNCRITVARGQLYKAT
jgi:hypothetical protein